MGFFDDYTETLEFEFVDSKLEQAQVYIQKFNRRAEKLGFPLVSLAVVGDYYQDIKDEISGLTVGRFHINKCKLSATVKLIINGWDFVAKVEPIVSDGYDNPVKKNMITKTPWHDQEIPDVYRTVAMDCQHCNSKRFRNAVFVLLSDEGEYKQVGSSCLKDFLGHDNPETILHYFEGIDALLTAFGEGGDEFLEYFGSGKRAELNIGLFMSYVVCAAEEDGYVSNQVMRNTGRTSTSENAILSMFGFNKQDPLKPKKEHIERADCIIDWAKAHFAEKAEKSFVNDYEWNMHLLFGDDFCNIKYAGFIASAYVGYIRYIEEQEKAKAMCGGESQFQWNIGDVITLEGTAISVLEISNNWGISFLTKFVVNGSVVTAFLSRSLNVGTAYKFIDVEVIKHNEFKGIKETQVKIAFRKKANKDEASK